MKKLYLLFLLLILFCLHGKCQDWKAKYEQAKTFISTFQYKQAIVELSAASTIVEKQLGRLDENTIAIHKLSGEIYKKIGDYANAATSYSIVEEALKEKKLEHTEEYRDALVGLGFVELKSKKYTKANQYLKKALYFIRKYKGEENDNYIYAYQIFINVFVAGKRYVDAKKHYQRLLPLIEKVQQKNEYYYSVFIDYADLLLKQGAFTQASKMHQEYLTYAAQNKLDPKKDNATYKKGFSSLANIENYEVLEKMIYQYLARLEDKQYKKLYTFEIDSTIHFFHAREQYAQVRNFINLKFDKKIPQAPRDIFFLVEAYINLNEFAEAKSKIDTLMQSVTNKESLNYAELLKAQGLIHKSQKKYHEAEESFFEAIRIKNKILNPKNQYPIEEYSLIFEEFYEENQLELANKYLNELKAIAKKYPKGHYINGVIKGDEAKLLVKQNKLKEAAASMLEKIKIFAAFYGKGNENYAHVVLEVADFYRGLGHLDKAKPYYLEAMKLYKKIEGFKGRKYMYIKDIFQNEYK